jgi:CheY-like chemotaxis protein
MRLLCADDDPDIRTILSLALRLDPQFDVETFASGTDLLTAARQAGADAVLLDVQMPDPDGLATCRALKADPITAHIPVVFLSASSAPAVLAETTAVGAVACLEKPFDPLTLAGTVKRVLAC